MDPNLNLFLNNAGYTVLQDGQGDVRIYLAAIISIALSVVGILFFLMILYAGYLWFSAGGNTEQVTKAQGFLKNALLGFIITLSAYVIVNFAANYLVNSLHDSALHVSTP